MIGVTIKYSTICRPSCPDPLYNRIIGCRLCNNRLLVEPIKQFPAAASGPTIESEGIFIDLIFRMLIRDCSLIGTHQPSLQQCGYSVAVLQKIFSNIRILSQHFMDIAKRFQPIVSVPPIGAHDTTWYHSLLNVGSTLPAEASATRYN